MTGPACSPSHDPSCVRRTPSLCLLGSGFLEDLDVRRWFPSHPPPCRLNYCGVDDPEEELRNWLNQDDYIDVMNALGITPEVDLD
jgi:hypothetical protein